MAEEHTIMRVRQQTAGTDNNNPTALFSGFPVFPRKTKHIFENSAPRRVHSHYSQALLSNSTEFQKISHLWVFALQVGKGEDGRVSWQDT